MSVRKKLPSGPDIDLGGITGELSDLADSAADAISSAAGYVPGLDDYRSTARRRRLSATVGGIVLVALVVFVIMKLRSGDDRTTDA